MIYDLSGSDWEILCAEPNVPLRENSMETGKVLSGITGWLKATVPGGTALPLFKAGFIAHPYFSMNSLMCEWISNKWWVYKKTVKKSSMNLVGKKFFIKFYGVDYECAVYVNNKLVATHTGMFTSFSVDITEEYLNCDQLEIKVLIKHAPFENGQIGKTSETSTQKSRFGYKWDFSTRLVNIGIWKKVEVISYDSHKLNDVFVSSDFDKNLGMFTISGTVVKLMDNERDDVLIETIVSLGGEIVKQSINPANAIFSEEIIIENPQVWQPNGYGKQPLYDIMIHLIKSGKVIDTFGVKSGIRRIEYCQNQDAFKDSLPYTLVVNGRRIYVKGLNIVPLDHIYGDIIYEQYEYIIKSAKDMNANLLRVWGGGIFETDEFYSLCNTYGLLVWQDFIQSSSGIDNVPAKGKAYLQLLSEASEENVKRIRNYTCLAIWCGGNELMTDSGKPSDYTDENIAMLKAIVEKHDFKRLFLPTTASGPNEYIIAPKGQAHDVHGWWTYQGNPGHYKLYGSSDSLFHSEFGCDGMSFASCMDKVLPKDQQKPQSMTGSDTWRFHGDWWCTYERDKNLFGDLPDMSTFIKYSQWMQAEGLGFILEANQRRKYQNSGSVIWQLNEPWPSISCTSLMTYYQDKKMAFYRAKKAFAAVMLSLDYRKLDYAENEMFSADIYAHTNSIDGENIKIYVRVLDITGKEYAHVSVEKFVTDNKPEISGRLEFTVSAYPYGLFFVHIKGQSEKHSYENIYIYSNRSDAPFSGIREKGKAGLKQTILEKTDKYISIELENTGRYAAVNTFVFDESDEFNLTCDDNFITIFPKERALFKIHYEKKFCYGFDEYFELSKSNEPLLTFDYL